MHFGPLSILLPYFLVFPQLRTTKLRRPLSPTLDILSFGLEPLDKMYVINQSMSHGLHQELLAIT